MTSRRCCETSKTKSRPILTRADLKELVAAELAALDADPGRMPWQDGLPEAFAVGLDPYRDRLEESYSPATNPFELLELDSGPHGVTLE